MVGVRNCVLFLSLAMHAWAGVRPPTIVQQPTNDTATYTVYFKEDEFVELPCVADGLPAPRYSWKYNDYYFNPDQSYYDGRKEVIRSLQLRDSGTIYFVRPRKRDQGWYQCLAANEYGTAASVLFQLREATLTDFEVLPDKSLRPRVGQPLTLDCNPPESHPEAFAFWVLSKPYGGFFLVNMTDRVTMDIDKRLHFTHVTREDEMGGLPYRCMVMNPVRRKSTQGPQHFIRPQGDTAAQSPASIMSYSAGNSPSLTGDNVTLNCVFGGNPTPAVSWSRLGDAPMPVRARTSSFGQQLTIENVQFEDAGTYVCSGTNDVTRAPVEQNVTVSVESRPYWSKKPENVEAVVGATAEFNCVARGVPEPDVTWFINGVPLECDWLKQNCFYNYYVQDPRIKSDRFAQPRPDRIVLSALTTGDRMVVQCEAFNTHGRLFGEAYLNVV